MLILIFVTICRVGGTLTAIDKLGQIGTSLGYPKQSISTFVSQAGVASSQLAMLLALLMVVIAAMTLVKKSAFLSLELLFGGAPFSPRPLVLVTLFELHMCKK
ncbi:hypothetical protein LguiB_013804 [Lonicera macranthoides]